MAGGVAGAVVLLGALAVLAYWLTKRRNAATAYAARDERGADVKEVANGGAGPGMVVNMHVRCAILDRVTAAVQRPAPPSTVTKEEDRFPNFSRISGCQICG